MQSQLILLVVFLVGFSNAVDKPGMCANPNPMPFGACIIMCGEDLNCKGSQKCCSNGCGHTCQDSACPQGVSKVDCPSSLCTFSQCPNAPDAECRIDSCGQCKVEHYNKTTWKKVACSNSGQHLCERMRDYGQSNPLPGRYVPTCTKEGKFDSHQRQGSVLFCVDEETGIPDFKTSTPIATGPPDCKKKAEKTECQLAKEKAMTLPPIGRFMPSCKDDGSYKEQQCHGSTGYCWCVDKKGREWFGTRQRGAFECTKSMCPGDVKRVKNCDPMICATATCPGYQNTEVSCRINPCGQCKAEFLDKYNRLVTCQTCANKRAKLLGGRARSFVGRFVPVCEADGNYKQVQCWGSVGQCWCVDRESGVQIDGTMTRGTPSCTNTRRTHLLGLLPPRQGSRTTVTPPRRQPVCPGGSIMLLCLRPFCQWSSGCASNAKATCRVNPCRMCAVEYFDEKNNMIDCNDEMSECQLKYADALSSKNIGLQPVGRFIPQCETDGNYSRIQCWASTGYCWCVDPKTGVEQELTRVRGKPNCAIKTHETMFVNNTKLKPGRCPTVKPTDSCGKTCNEDKDCEKEAKCCAIGCGKTCRKPSEEQLACPNGRPFLLCLHHCQLASCAAYPHAQCSANPCQFCTVRFKDKNGSVVNCSEKLTACEVQRASSPALLGSFRPQCESDGRYKSVQCYGSIGFCWCVDEAGREINGTRQSGSLDCSTAATKKALTKCQKMRLKATQSGLLGAKVPQCEDNGSFKKIQFWEGYQWCVDVDGIELVGTRAGPGESKPDCSKACSPVMCMMYCQYGFDKDSRGCYVCRCALAPYKPGKCPSSKPTSDVACTEDLDCGGTMKCCDKKCSLPVNYVKPGYCPRINTTRGGDCESKCTHDSDCNGDSKCCASGCSRMCSPPAREVCPNGAPLVMCLRNMCDTRIGCAAFPQATCRMNYCGQCSAEFVLPNGTIVNCGNTDDKVKDIRKCTSGKSKTMFFCSPSLCDGQTCAKNPNAVCKVPSISCDCNVAFYDKNGNEINCLTKCQQRRKELESGPLLLGAFKPKCEPDGTYSRQQCSGSTGYCWCVSKDGTEWPKTKIRGKLDCSEKKQPKIRSIRVELSFDANYDSIKDDTKNFKAALVEHIKSQFGVHPEQIKEMEINRGSIVVKFVLLKHDDGKDIRNVSGRIRDMVLEGEFVFEFGGETMVAKPESYTSNRMMEDEAEVNENSSSPVLAIVLGVVFGLLAIVIIIGALVYVRRRTANKNYRGMSVTTQDSTHPLAK